ncbi:MAG: STAS domain-containing protein [Desulfovibrio sp.]|jgi:anti-anti-sigma regulatory factor|nr:STAS domain-containing protein [Desulfovibrio sp.]
MDYLIDVNPLESLAEVLALNIAEYKDDSRYACRAFSAHGNERQTVFGCFQGRIALKDNQEFKAALYDLVSENTGKVILDFKDVHLSRSAVGVLVGFAASMHGRNKRLYLYRPSPQIRASLLELELLPFFRILESEADVVAGLRL